MKEVRKKESEINGEHSFKILYWVNCIIYLFLKFLLLFFFRIYLVITNS